MEGRRRKMCGNRCPRFTQPNEVILIVSSENVLSKRGRKPFAVVSVKDAACDVIPPNLLF